MNRVDVARVSELLDKWAEHLRHRPAADYGRGCIEGWATGVGLVMRQLGEDALADRAEDMGRGGVPYAVDTVPADKAQGVFVVAPERVE